MDGSRQEGQPPRTAESSTSTSGVPFAFVKSGTGLYDQQRHNVTGIHTPPNSTSSSARGTAFTSFNRYAYQSSTRPPSSQSDSATFTTPRHHQLAPPPLAPYVRPEDRFIAPYPENLKPPTSNTSNPSIPPPQRPAPSYIPAPPVRPQAQAPPSPPSSRGQHAVPPLSREDERRNSQSGSSSHSAYSPNAGNRHSGDDTGLDKGSDVKDTKSERKHVASDDVGKAGGGDDRSKRTRVLMTHLQQQNLSRLWKATKFPNTQEREEVASEVGLTARQVQVWFQNRRQTNRKHIKERTVPEDADPRDYSDLQQSPATRRSLLLSEERTSSWASSMEGAGPSSTTATRGDHGTRTGLPSLASLTELHPDDYTRDYPHFRPQTSDSYNSTSSSRHQLPRINHLSGVLSPSRQKLDSWESPVRASNPYDTRPHTTSAFHTLRPPMMSNSGSTDSSASLHSSSNHPYSPPPTADAQRFHLNAPPPHLYTQTSTPDPSTRTNLVEEPRRPSSLPPSLAALVITRPVSLPREIGQVDGGVTLPGIASIRSGVGTVSSPASGMGRVARAAHQRGTSGSALGLSLGEEGSAEDHRGNSDDLPPFRRSGEPFR